MPFQRKTILIYVEGDDEDCFVKYLRDLYAYTNGSISIHVFNNMGGSSDDVVIKGFKRGVRYDLTYIMLDSYKELSEELRQRAFQEGVTLIENTPSFDAVLLSISNPGINYEGRSERWCKEEFRRTYMSKEHGNSTEGFKEIYPKGYLNERRNTCSRLHELINIIEGKTL